MRDFFKEYLFIFEVVIAAVVFGVMFLVPLTLSSIIVWALSFIIILELVRIIVDFILKEEHVLNIKYILDGFIAFFLRDVVLIFSDKNISFDDKVMNILFLLFVILVFFIFRLIRQRIEFNRVG